MQQAVPGFLGKVIGEDGRVLGTCFQVAPGVVITAFHVSARQPATGADSGIRVGQLDGDELPCKGRVVLTDQPRDLAVLRIDRPLRASKNVVVASNRVKASSEVTVTGWVDVTDPGHEHEFLESGGVWRGLARRDGMLWGRVQADAVMPGMSGAPVIRLSDGAIIGVVSGRYNSVDGWLAGSVWVSRTEDLVSLLDGVDPAATGVKLTSTAASAAGHNHGSRRRLLIAGVAVLLLLLSIVAGASIWLHSDPGGPTDVHSNAAVASPTTGPPTPAPSTSISPASTGSPTPSDPAGPGVAPANPTTSPTVKKSRGPSLGPPGTVRLAAPRLVSPPDEIVYMIPDTVNFAWDSVSGAAEYILETEATDGTNWQPVETYRQTARTRQYQWEG